MKALAAIGLAGLALGGALSWLHEAPRTRAGSLEPREAGAGSPELDVASASELATPAGLPELAFAPPAPAPPPAPAAAPASMREAAAPSPAPQVPIQSLEGRVLFPAGTPADEQAFVIVQSWSGTRHEQKVPVAADGTFRIELPADVRDTQLALEARYLYLEQPVRWQRDGAEAIVLQPRLGLWIQGLVVDDGGAPLESFTITASGVGATSWHGRPAPSRSFEHAGGSFWMGGFAPGAFDLLVRSHGHVTSTTRIHVPSASPIRLVLSRSAVIRGVVVTPHGVPVPRARIEVRPDGAGRDTRQADPQGRFEIDGLVGGRATLRAMSYRFAPSEPVTVELVAGTRVDDLRLELRQGGSTLLNVFLRKQPVDAVLSITDASGTWHPAFAVGKGAYRFGPAAAGTYTVLAQRDGKTLERAFEVVPGTRERELELVFD